MSVRRGIRRNSTHQKRNSDNFDNDRLAHTMNYAASIRLRLNSYIADAGPLLYWKCSKAIGFDQEHALIDTRDDAIASYEIAL